MTKTSKIKREIKEFCEMGYKNGFNPLPSVRERFKGVDVVFYHATAGADYKGSAGPGTLIIVLEWIRTDDGDDVPEVKVLLG